MISLCWASGYPPQLGANYKMGMTGAKVRVLWDRRQVKPFVCCVGRVAQALWPSQGKYVELDSQDFPSIPFRLLAARALTAMAPPDLPQHSPSSAFPPTLCPPASPQHRPLRRPEGSRGTSHMHGKGPEFDPSTNQASTSKPNWWEVEAKG